jgi:hypothetical protein
MITGSLHVDKRSKLSYKDFANNYMVPGKPVILEDAAESWNAVTKWTPDYFKDKFPTRVMSADGKSYKVAEYVDILHASSKEKPAPYMHNQNIAEVFPELVEDVSPTPFYCQPNWLHDHYFPSRLDNIMRRNSVVEAYIGGPGGVFPVIHYDSIYTHAFLTQIYGDKELHLWGPDQSQYMYALNRNNVSEVNDAVYPDLEKYPLFAKAEGASVVLQPGQTIFIPGGLWHTARMLTESITVSINIANASNWAGLTRDIFIDQSPPVRMAMSLYLGVLGAMKRGRPVPTQPSA